MKDTTRKILAKEMTRMQASLDYWRAEIDRLEFDLAEAKGERDSLSGSIDALTEDLEGVA